LLRNPSFPPNQHKHRLADNLVFGGITLSPLHPASSRDTILYFPPKQNRLGYDILPTPMLIAVFDASNSPVKFRSFITYSTDEKFMTERYLDSKFYVSRVLELPQSAFRGQPDVASVEQSNHNMWASPNYFYIFTKEGLKGNIR
jgi:hypothetical protein